MDDKINQAIERLSEIIYNQKDWSNAKKVSIFDNSTTVNIDTDVLRECGFDVDSPNGILFSLICPRLKREGVLEAFSGVSHDYGDLSGKYLYVSFRVNPEGLRQKFKIPNVLPKTEYRDGVLYFQSKEINFNNSINQKDLLITLFKYPEKNWFYDEVQEDWDKDWQGYSKSSNPKLENYWRKFYTAGRAINTVIALETNIIKDFIIKTSGTRGSIKINPKYL